MAVKSGLLKTVSSDDFEFEADEEVIYPHKGENVTFRRRVSPNDLMLIARAGELQEKQDNARLADFFYNEVCPALSRSVQKWTWKDMFTGEAYPKEPTVDDFRNLDALTELQYLLGAWITAASPGASEKNPP